MKTLIIHGSPRKSGDSSSLASSLKELLSGDFMELSVYRNNINPCVDCRFCSKNSGCAIKDDMQLIYDDNFDRVVLASPVYMSTLPGPLVSLASRFQVYYASRRFQGVNVSVRPKPSALILAGGGNGRADEALRLGKLILKNIGGFDPYIITSLCTDKIPATEDAQALVHLSKLAHLWNAKTPR